MLFCQSTNLDVIEQLFPPRKRYTVIIIIIIIIINQQFDGNKLTPFDKLISNKTNNQRNEEMQTIKTQNVTDGLKTGSTILHLCWFLITFTYATVNVTLELWRVKLNARKRVAAKKTKP